MTEQRYALGDRVQPRPGTDHGTPGGPGTITGITPYRNIEPDYYVELDSEPGTSYVFVESWLEPAPSRTTERTLAYRGPCFVCGCSDARHRDVDAWAGRVLAGDDPAAVAADHGVPDAWVLIAALAAGWRQP